MYPYLGGFFIDGNPYIFVNEVTLTEKSKIHRYQITTKHRSVNNYRASLFTSPALSYRTLRIKQVFLKYK